MSGMVRIDAPAEAIQGWVGNFCTKRNYDARSRGLTIYSYSLPTACAVG